LSWYQLTLEPRTPFHRTPPQLPDDEVIEAMQGRGLQRLKEAGFVQYEVSAFARPGRRCRHNLNYWTFGDYLGVGAGAHGKMTDPSGLVRRRWRVRHPSAYVAAAGSLGTVRGEQVVRGPDLGLEFALNVLRLVDGVDESLFAARCFQSLDIIAEPVARARTEGMLVPDRLQATPQGWRYLDTLVGMFCPN
jgi:oxygen-independent coproporphyrinogen-3 oxidase